MPHTQPEFIEQPIDRALALLATSLNQSQSDTKLAAPIPNQAIDTKPIAELPDDDTNDERREHPRRDSTSRVMMSFGLMDVADPAWTFRTTPHRGQLLDLSMRGAAFDSERPVAENTVVVLRLTGDEFDSGRIMRAKIIRCDKVTDGYRVVCRFDEKLTLEDLYQYSRHRFSHDIV